MKIKVGDKIYDGDKEPVMIILSEADKKNISQMSPTATKYCSYPDTPEWTGENHKKIQEWMKTE